MCLKWFFLGLTFYKRPLDMMYADYMTEVMSRADWYALAAVTAVEVAAELSGEWLGEESTVVELFSQVGWLPGVW